MAVWLQLMIWLLFIVLIIAAPLYEWYKLRDRLRRAENRALEAETTLQRTVAALGELDQLHLQKYMTTPHPTPNPPGFQEAFDVVEAKHYGDPFAIPLGWATIDGEPDLATVSFHGESEFKVNHVLVTGETDKGKDVWLFQALAVLCRRATPREVQIYYIDGKGPDGSLWEGKAHNWRPPVAEAEDIPAAVTALEVERTKRSRLLRQQVVTKWEELPPDKRPPLLVVVVSELKLLKKALGSNLEAWLETELAAARAAGIRYVIASQNVTNMKTEWRSQLSLFVAGFQSSRAADMPNIGFGTEEIREKGGLPPSELPGAGYFTVRSQREVVSVRASYVTLAERKLILSQLPRLLVSSTAAPASSSALESSGSGFPDMLGETQKPPIVDLVEAGRLEEMKFEEKVSQRFEEKRAAVEAAITDQDKTDGQILKDVFGVTGGRYYDPLKQKVIALRSSMKEPAAMSA